MKNAWEPLVKGDKIAFVFPSHRPKYRGGSPEAEIASYKQWVQKFDLTLNNEDSLNSLLNEQFWGEKSGAAQRRAMYIIDALNDPEVKVIYACGGSGGDEVIHALEQYYSDPANLPKRADAPPLIGFSDATQLQMYLGEKGLVSPIQVASSLDGGPDIKDLLFKQNLPRRIPLIPINDAANQAPAISGKTIGGNDWAILTAQRTNYRLVTTEDRNNILLLEGLETRRIPEVLEMLKTQGQLANIKAIVLGKCYGNKGNEALKECNLSEIIEVSKDLNIPVFFGIPFGHTKVLSGDNKPLNFLPLPLNTETTIDSRNGKSAISFSQVRSIEDVEAAKAAYAVRQPWHPYKTKDSNTFISSSPVFQSVVLHSIHGDKPELEAPKKFIGCGVVGTDIPAIEGVDLKGENLFIHIPPEEGHDLNLYWTLAQKSTMPLMELVKMGAAKDIKSITFAAPVVFPDRIKEYIKNFTNEHFSGTPVFTTTIPLELEPEAIKELNAPSRSSPLLMKFNDIRVENKLSPEPLGYSKL